MSADALTGRSAALPGDDRDLRRLGYGILLVVFGGFGGWAALAPLDSAAVAPGVITVQNYRRTVQHLEGGIVREIRVHYGDKLVMSADLDFTISENPSFRFYFLPQAGKGELRAEFVDTADLRVEQALEVDPAKVRLK